MTEVEVPVADMPKEDAKPAVLDINRPLTQQVDKILAQMPKEEEKKDEKPSEDEPKKESTSSEKKTEEPNDPEKEPEFIADDEEDEPLAEPIALPEWQKYVMENLPTIQTVGHTGEDKDKVFTVKRLEDLPEDFEFASKRAELAFNAALSAQEINARDLLKDYKQKEVDASVQKSQAQEAIDVQKDIQSLQREGVLPKFKYSEKDARFNDDPAVKEANEIYDLYTKVNHTYVEQYNKTGQTYKISYKDAADKYYARKAREEASKPKEEQPKSDPKPQANQERTRVASKVSAPQSETPDAQKRGIRSGTTPQDIYKLYKAGRI